MLSISGSFGGDRYLFGLLFHLGEIEIRGGVEADAYHDVLRHGRKSGGLSRHDVLAGGEFRQDVTAVAAGNACRGLSPVALFLAVTLAPAITPAAGIDYLAANGSAKALRKKKRHEQHEAISQQMLVMYGDCALVGHDLLLVRPSPETGSEFVCLPSAEAGGAKAVRTSGACCLEPRLVYFLARG